MYRVTPLDNKLPSPYELLFGRKPRTLLPSTKRTLQSSHPENDKHQERNYERQEKQAKCYDKKAGADKRIINNMEPVYVRNTIKRIWEPGIVLNRPNPVREPRTYIVNVNGKVYYRTREHLKPRSNNMSEEIVNTRREEHPRITTAVTRIPTEIPPTSTATPSTPRKTATPTTQKTPPTTAKVRSPMKPPPPPIIVEKEGKATLQPKSQTTRSGRTTQVPAKFRD